MLSHHKLSASASLAAVSADSRPWLQCIAVGSELPTDGGKNPSGSTHPPKTTH
jgi:hypothetical protein